MSSKKWIIKNSHPAEFAEKFPGYSPVVLTLLFSRGLDTQEKIDEFLNPDYSQDLHNPFLFQDMQKAVDRINLAISKKQKILIHGDYDADGTTASAVLFSTLKKLGAENVEVFIPHRENDGYGINSKNVEKFISDKIDLLITVDCGISNFDQVEKLNQNKIDAIITDHHIEPKKLPNAIVILNCALKREKYPFKKLAGVGMAFKLAQALLKSQNNISPLTKGRVRGVNSLEAFEKWLLDLVTIGTIGDISPILGENRVLVKYGLMVLNKTQRPGLRELICTCSLSNGHDPNDEIPLGEELYDLSVRNVSFQLVPRLNAMGRIADANITYKLLVTENDVEAIAFARDIHEKNLERQKIAEQMLEQAKEKIGTLSVPNTPLSGVEKSKLPKILITSSEDWLPGMVGLTSGKLKDIYSRPVILFSEKENVFVGSGRSILEFNITQAVSECSDFVEKSGGHSQACGLTINGQENFKKFQEKIKLIAQEKLKNVELIPSIEIDAEVKLKDLDWDFWDELQKFEPFAEANPMPLFLIKKIKIESIDKMGKNNNHLRFLISQGDAKHKAISFFTADDWHDNIKAGEIYDLVVEFGVNEWNGNRELQFKIVDYNKS